MCGEHLGTALAAGPQTTLSNKAFRSAEHTLEAGRTWEMGKESVEGSWRYLRAKAAYIWPTISLLGTVDALAALRLTASEGRGWVCF